ncbi:MAG: ABC transporter permease subunit [Gammaproteobacteria bacterium]|nr:ABC transporter permease subunit [Gammaproteobacteria bacterium]
MRPASAGRATHDRLWRAWVIAAPFAWLIVLFLIPFVLVFKISLADPILGQPPFTPLFGAVEGAQGSWHVTFDNYRFLFADNLYLYSYLKSLKVAFISTVLCLAVGYPMAYGIARAARPWRHILLLLVILPFWTSFLLRVYAWMGMLGKQGLVNTLLLQAGLVDEPVSMLYTDFAVYIGIVYTYLPFMILPLYANLERRHRDLHEVAADLGARPLAVFLDVTLPLSIPGIIAGCMLVFIPAIGEFVIPALLGGPETLMIGRTLYDEFFFNRDWPLSSAVATVLVFILVLPIMVFQHYQVKETRMVS